MTVKNSKLFGVTIARSNLEQFEDEIYKLLEVNTAFLKPDSLGFFDAGVSLDSALKLINQDPYVIMTALNQVIRERENKIEILPAPIQVAISSRVGNKVPSEKLRFCRLEFFVSYSYGVLCAACLGGGKGELTSPALFFLGRLEFNLGCAMSHADSLSWPGPYGKFGAFDPLASLGAYAKLAMDPKQKEKLLVRDCWDEWQKQPERYKGKAAFARDMLDKFESLKSQPVIERWCREWDSACHPASTIDTLPAK